MTHLQLAAASIIIGLLVAIGWGVWRVLRHTSFVAAIIARNVRATEDLEDEPEPQEDDHSMPIGFGVRLRERN
jgi:hypothetical protein